MNRSQTTLGFGDGGDLTNFELLKDAGFSSSVQTNLRYTT